MASNTTNKQNPTSSPHLQAILDLILVLEDDSMTLKEARDLLLEDGKLECYLINKLNELWNRHLYPDRVLKFAPIALLDLAANILDLSPEAIKILVVMVLVQHQRTGYVAVRKNVFAKACKFGNKRLRQMQDYLDELVNGKFIKSIYQPPKGSTAAAIYQVSRKFSRIGSTFKPDILDKNYIPLYSRSVTTIKVKDSNTKNSKDKKETIYKCGTIEEVIYLNNQDITPPTTTDNSNNNNGSGTQNENGTSASGSVQDNNDNNNTGSVNKSNSNSNINNKGNKNQDCNFNNDDIEGQLTIFDSIKD